MPFRSTWSRSVRKGMFGRARPPAAAAPQEVNRAERSDVRMEFLVLLPDREPVQAVAENLSTSGFLATIPLDLADGALLRVSFQEGRARHARIARRDGGRYGCEFVAPMTDEEVATLRHDPA